MLAQRVPTTAEILWRSVSPSFKRYLEALPIISAIADLVKSADDAAMRFNLYVNDLYSSEDLNEYQGVVCVREDVYVFTCFSFWDDVDGTRLFASSSWGSFAGVSYRIDGRAAAIAYGRDYGLRLVCRRDENRVWRCSGSDVSAEDAAKIAEEISRAIEDGLKRVFEKATGLARYILDECSRGAEWCDNRLASKAGDVLLLIEGSQMQV